MSRWLDRFAWARRWPRLAGILAILAAAAIVYRVAFAAVTNFQNGSFETGISLPTWTTLTSVDTTSITGWTVTQGKIDYISSNTGPPSNGSRALDLGGLSSGSQTGATAGGIAQTFLTTVGTTYTVLFDMGGNSANTPVVKHMNVSAAGTTTAYTFDTSSLVYPDPGWTTKTFTFTATSTNTTLSFVITDVTTAGAMLDNVRVQVPITGTVYEDVNYGGGAGRDKTTALAGGGTVRSGARVELYNSAGTFVSATTTNASGVYTFDVDMQASYTVRVVNSTVSSARSGYVSTLLPVQTYRTTATTGTAVAVTDRVGGETPTKVDAGNGSTTLAALTTTSATPQSITSVTIGNGGVTGVDFGFNFDTIVNTNDSGQGSLRQWIVNANAFDDQTALVQSGSRKVGGVTSALPSGYETSIFMVSNGTAVAGLRAGITNQLTAGGWVKISPATVLPTIVEDHVALDGATQTANVGNTNSGTTGSGGTVGVSATALPLFDDPELEIYDTFGLTFSGVSDAMRSFAHSGGSIYVNGDSSQVTDVLVGMDAQGTSNATTNAVLAYGINIGGGSNIVIRHNYVRVDNSGIRRDGTATGTLIEYNEIGVPYNGQDNTFDGIILATGTNDTIQYNYIHNQVGAGFEVAFGGGTNLVFQENTLTGNGVTNGAATSSTEPGAIMICGSVASPRPQLTVYRNIITGSGGPAVDVLSGAGFKITQNSIYNNGVGGTVGLGIDLDTSGRNDCNNTTPPNGVTVNTGVTNAALPNNGMNFPVITSAGVTGTALGVAGYVGTAAGQSAFANATVEFFKSSSDASGYGEGQTYLGSLTTDANGNFNGTIVLSSSSLFSLGNALTATATDANGNTSEFSANFTVNSAYPVSPNRFNAFETSTAANSITGVITTKIAGSSFGLDIVAVNAAGTGVYTTFTGTVTLQLLDASNNTGALGANGCRSTWVNLGSSANVTFVGANNGRLTNTFAAVADAYRDVRVQMSYTPPFGGATVVSCSTDDFAIRPNKLALLTATDTDWASAGAVRTLANTGTSGGNVHKAGRAFTLSATAQNSAGVKTSLYSGTLTSALTCVLPAGCTAADLGTLTFTATVSAGVFNATDAVYSEVGAFNLVLTDTTFAAVDAADSTTAQRYVVSDAVNVGRFVPDHFALSTTTNGTLYTFGSGSCATRSFTYLGQTVTYSTPPTVTITAQNASNATTRNYKGTLWKLTSASIGQTYTDAGGAALTATVGSATVTSNGNGTGTATANAADSVVWTRSTTTPSAPFTAQPVDTISASDTSETSGTITSTTSAAANPTFDAGASMRFGRLAIGNAFGIETLKLTVPLETQYYTGTVWITTSDDFCTTVPASVFAMGNWQNALAACETSGTSGGTASRGRIALTLSAPGTGNAGSVDLTPNVGSVASGNTCLSGASSAATAASLSWLQGKWGGAATYTANPTARASFGQFNLQAGFRRER